MKRTTKLFFEACLFVVMSVTALFITGWYGLLMGKDLFPIKDALVGILGVVICIHSTTGYVNRFNRMNWYTRIMKVVTFMMFVLIYVNTYTGIMDPFKGIVCMLMIGIGNMVWNDHIK